MYVCFFQLDEKCDKQYSDYSRVSSLLLCILKYFLSVFFLKLKPEASF